MADGSADGDSVRPLGFRPQALRVCDRLAEVLGVEGVMALADTGAGTQEKG